MEKNSSTRNHTEVKEARFNTEAKRHESDLHADPGSLPPENSTVNRHCTNNHKCKKAKAPPPFAPVSVTTHIRCRKFHMDCETCTHKEKEKKTGALVGILALMPDMHPANIMGAHMCIQAMKRKSHRGVLNIYHIWS